MSSSISGIGAGGSGSHFLVRAGSHTPPSGTTSTRASASSSSSAAAVAPAAAASSSASKTAKVAGRIDYPREAFELDREIIASLPDSERRVGRAILDNLRATGYLAGRMDDILSPEVQGFFLDFIRENFPGIDFHFDATGYHWNPISSRTSSASAAAAGSVTVSSVHAASSSRSISAPAAAAANSSDFKAGKVAADSIEQFEREIIRRLPADQKRAVEEIFDQLKRYSNGRKRLCRAEILPMGTKTIIFNHIRENYLKIDFHFNEDGYFWNPRSSRTSSATAAAATGHVTASSIHASSSSRSISVPAAAAAAAASSTSSAITSSSSSGPAPAPAAAAYAAVNMADDYFANFTPLAERIEALSKHGRLSPSEILRNEEELIDGLSIDHQRRARRILGFLRDPEIIQLSPTLPPAIESSLFRYIRIALPEVEIKTKLWNDAPDGYHIARRSLSSASTSTVSPDAAAGAAAAAT